MNKSKPQQKETADQFADRLARLNENMPQWISRLEERTTKQNERASKSASDSDDE